MDNTVTWLAMLMIIKTIAMTNQDQGQEATAMPEQELITNTNCKVFLKKEGKEEPREQALFLRRQHLPIRTRT